MIQAITLFAKQILGLGGFRVGQLPRKVVSELMTAFSSLLEKEVVILEPILDLIKQKEQGVLVIDDTSNPKYGLTRWTTMLKRMGAPGFERGYKILLFLWECPSGRIPIGFALWHKESPTMTELLLKGLSLLRNRYGLKPEVTLADGAFSTDEPLKRLTDYGWPLIMRFKRNRKFARKRMDKLIPRGYGNVIGRLKNSTKVKVFRRKSCFFVCNRMLWEVQKVLKLYDRRWCIEETFRAAKSCLAINGCQQHTMKAQALYLFVLFLLFASIEIVSDSTFYKTFQRVISGEILLEDILNKGIFSSC